ncbi:nicotinate phosphoribosyltransferase [Halorussus halophilus]|uniref:nicotinate phosphoribosyltransferase n=1 Tax=Halorussus halophilus TaxID=2650975 RepID=UPI001300E2A1|nr:nicotinate phosphoribosyltransferase [Halorussus halophilus]
MSREKFESDSASNHALFTDLYELTMMQGYLETGHNPQVTFSLFFRTLPQNRGYIVAAGLAQVVEYLETLTFADEELDYLAGLEGPAFSEEFLSYLDGFEFTGDVRAVPEGTVVFPNEPLVEVTAPILEAQLFETFLINQLSFQSLVATKAARMRDTIREHGDGQSLVDFGSRRAHGTDAGLKAARAAYVGGFDGTSNVAAGRAFDLPVFGTMAHSWVQSFETERESFEAFVSVYGEDSVLLVDTYDTVEGAKTAMAVADELDVDIAGVRLDSGDLVSLSKQVAKIVGDSGIVVSSSVDEYAIAEFLTSEGVATGFGPGTALVTSSDAPTLDTVYKLVAVERDGELRPSMKLSTGKVTYPGQKSLRRVERDGQFERDVLGIRGEERLPGEEQLVEVFDAGSLVYSLPSLEASRDRRADQLQKLPGEVRAIRDPAEYRVGISDGLQSMTERIRDELTEQYGAN